MFGDLFRQIYRAPLVLARTLIKSPMSVFVYGIMSKWYLMVMLTAIVVTFWVFKGLEKSGALQAAQNVVFKALGECKAVAQNCTPLIMNLPAMWDCINNTPAYEQSSDEVNMENDANELMKATAPRSESGSVESDQPNQANPYEH